MILRWWILLILSLSASVCRMTCIMRPNNQLPCGRVSRATGDIVLVRCGARIELPVGQKLYSNDMLVSKGGRAILLLYPGDSYEIYPDSVTCLPSRFSTIDLIERTISRAKVALRRLLDESNIGAGWRPSAVIAVRG
jgi:hypothetical protein